MSALNKIAYFSNQRSDAPNQELAKALAESHDRAGIKEIADSLRHPNKSIQSDCLKVLYEIGYITPDLIAEYVSDFLQLLKSNNNRMVWGAMIALSTIASQRAKEIWIHIDDVIHAVENGSVITVVNGVKTIAQVAAANKEYNKKLFPMVINILKTCIPRDVPTHGESMLCMIHDDNKNDFLKALKSREEEMTPAQQKRLQKVLKTSGHTPIKS